MYVITVTFTVNAGHETAFLERVKQQARDSLEREPQCHTFDVCTPDGGTSQVFLYEIYENEAAFKTHLESQHFLDFSRDTEPMVADKVVTSWLRHEA